MAGHALDSQPRIHQIEDTHNCAFIMEVGDQMIKGLKLKIKDEVNLTVMSYGLQIGWLASVASVLQSEKSPTGSPLSTIDISWLASTPSLAAMLSIPLWTILVDKYGRKPCILICAILPVPILASSFVVSLASFSALAAMLLVQGGASSAAMPQWLPAAVLTLAVCAYAAAVSPMPTVIMAEMFNFRIRAKVMGCLVMVGFAGAFVQTLIFGPMSDAFGAHVTFIFYAIINLCGSLVVLVLLPETKMKSVEEIEIELEKKLQR